jgi:hypothetical protein
MDERQRNKLALSRFALIVPVIDGSLDGSINEYLETTCAKTYDVPGVGRQQYSPRTLRVWRSHYQQYGLEVPKMKLRRDCGGYHRLSLGTQTLHLNFVQ